MNHLQELGQYHIDVHLGSNPFADVYRATDTIRRRTVALKVLKAEAGLSDYLDQASLASQLVHPHIAWVWEAGEIDGYSYLTERYISGPSLRTALKQTGPITWNAVLKVILQISQALDFSHAKQWVHGDLRPATILVSEDQGAVLSDYGITQARRGRSQQQTHSILSAPMYTAPEVWKGEPAGPEADQYALACTIVEMLTTEPFFAAATTREIRTRHLGPIELPSSYPRQVPQDLNPVISKALSKDPSIRFPSAGAFAQALEELPTPRPSDESKKTTQAAWGSAWHLAQEQKRLEAEEVERMAALEQARRELEAEMSRELPAAEKPPPIDITPSEPVPPPYVQTIVTEDSVLDTANKNRRSERRRGNNTRRILVVGLIIIIIALSGLLLDLSLSRGGIFPATATETMPPATMKSTATVKASATKTEPSTNTPESSPTSTSSPTPTATLTGTPTATFTPAETPTITNTSEFVVE